MEVNPLQNSMSGFALVVIRVEESSMYFGLIELVYLNNI